MYSSDEEAAGPDPIPRHLLRERTTWQLAYEEEIAEVFRDFLCSGRAWFGDAFYQMGTVRQFADFVFKHTQPGATKSNIQHVKN